MWLPNPLEWINLTLTEQQVAMSRVRSMTNIQRNFHWQEIMHIAREICEQSVGPCDMILNEVDVFECVAHPKKLQVEDIISSRWKSRVGNMCLSYSLWSHILWLIWTPFFLVFVFF